MGWLAIEGLPAAGKSTIAELLERKGHNVVPELGKMISIDNMPGDGETLEEILKIDDWFISQEARRFTEAEDGILDRCFFSHLAYSYAYSCFSGIDAFKSTLKKYEEAIGERRLKLPDGVAFIKIEPETSIRRQVEVGRRLPNFWREKTFLINLSRAYFQLLYNLKNIEVSLIDGKREIADILSEIEEVYFHLPNKKNKKIDFDQFYFALTKKCY